MVNNNAGNNIDVENNSEKVEEQKKQNNLDLYSKMYNDFYEFKRTQVDFLDILYSHGELVLNELKEFKNKNEKYKDLDDNKIDIITLQTKYKSDYLSLINNRNILKSKIIRDYDISQEIYNTKVDNEVKLLSLTDLKKLFIDEHLDNFLLLKLGKNKPQKKEFLNIVNDILGEIKTLKLSEQDKKELDDIVKSLRSKHGPNDFKQLDDGDIYEILSLFKFKNISFNLREKFLRNYFPLFSFKDYKQVFNLNNETLIKSKNEIVSKLFPEFNKMNQKDQDLFLESIDEDKLLISTGELSRDGIISLFNNENFFIKMGKLYKDYYNYNIEQIESIKPKIGLEKFSEELLLTGKFGKNINFVEGNIICINTLEIEETIDNFGNPKNIENASKIFLKIASIDEKNNKFSYYECGTKGLYKPNGLNKVEIDFYSFLFFIKNGVENSNKDGSIKIEKGCEILYPDDLMFKISKNQYKLDKDVLLQKSVDEIDDEYAIRKLMEQGFNKEDITREQIDEFIGKESSSINDLNYNSLVSSIDQIDPDGKSYGLDNGTTFVTKEGHYYTILEINKNEGIIKLVGVFNSGVSEEATFQDFYDRYKESDIDGKRKSNVRDFDSLFVGLTDEKNSWKQFKLKDGKILKSSTNNEIEEKQTNIKYDYLVAEKGNDFIKGSNILKIEKIVGDTATITLGNMEDSKKDKKTVYSMDTNSINIKLSVLDSWIRKADLKPESLDSHNDFIESKYETMDRKGKFISRFLSRISFNEMVKGGKFWLDSIKSYMSEGNEEHAARFAEGVLGKILPKGIRYDLKSRLESSQKKRMEDYKQRLKDLDSADSTALVYKWLMNKNSPEPQKEAAMIFMMESYGSLYAKKALFPHRGKWLWYEAMGGKVGDALFNEKKKWADGLDIQFTEEDLIYALISKQCKNGKRRGRLYKEVEALIGKGRDAEYDKGKADAEKKRTIKHRVDFAIGELSGGSYPNAMGAFEAIVGKGDDGNYTTLNKVPFIMAFSGLAYDFDQKMVDGFKNNPVNGRPVMSTMFMSNQSKIELFSKTVLELSKDLSKIHNDKFPDMYKEALAIYSKQQDSSDQGKKVKETEKFFDKYGEVLTRSMNMLMTGKKDDLSKTDQIILLKKDELGKGIYKRYYNTFKAFISGYTTFAKEEYITDAFDPEGASGIIGMDTYKIAKETLLQAQGGGFRQAESGPKIWTSFIAAMDEVKATTYSEDEKENERIKKVIIKDKLGGLLAGLLVHHGGNPNAWKGLVDQGTSSFFTKFNEWGIVSRDFSNNNITYERMLNSDKDEQATILLEKYANNILHGKEKVDEKFTIPYVKESVGKNVDGIVN